MRKVILLFEGRTGSSLLTNMLWQSDGVIWYGEEVAKLKDKGWTAQKKWMDELFLLEPDFTSEKSFSEEQTKLIGFKVKLRDIADTTQFRSYIHENKIDVLHMKRDNFIKQVLSSIRAMDLAQKSGQYNLHKGDEALQLGCYEIPVRKFNNTLLWLYDFEKNLDSFISTLSDEHVFELTYENFTSDIKTSFRQLCDEFSIEPVHGAEPSLIKATSDNMAEAVSNYNALKQFYSDSIFAKYFD